MNRINRLKYEFGETNLNSDEIVSAVYRKEINKKYYNKQNFFIIDSVLADLDNHVRKMVKVEVYDICKKVRFKDLCHTCKVEQIIAIIILYVWKTRHAKLREDQTGLWKKYDITYKKYALVLGRLLQKSRENSAIK